MKMRIHACVIFCLVLFGTGCERSQLAKIKDQYPESFSLSLENTIDLARKDAITILDIEDLKKHQPNFDAQAFLVLDNGWEIAGQADDLDGDDILDQIAFVADFEPGEIRNVTVRYAPGVKKERHYTKRTQAELSHKIGGAFIENHYVGGEFRNVGFLRVPDEHIDHDTYIRYEGPGWESDKVGYRFYMDRRNAIDIFGKKVSDLVLQDIGLEGGYDSWHEMSDWGMDVFQVGESLGIGSIAMWSNGKVYRVSQTDSITCEIIANGAVRSQIQTRYYGWKVGADSYDLTSNLIITAGSRMTAHRVTVTGNPPNLCTGMAKHEDCTILQPSDEVGNRWRYFGLYGPQSLAGDQLGIALIYHQSNFVEMAEDSLSHVIILEPEGGELTYYFVAAWEQEPDGIQSIDEFHQYLDRVVLELENPLIAGY